MSEKKTRFVKTKIKLSVSITPSFMKILDRLSVKSNVTPHEYASQVLEAYLIDRRDGRRTTMPDEHYSANEIDETIHI